MCATGAQGNGFFVGLAFWPGGSAEDWGAIFNATTGQFGLHPCNTTGTYQKTAKTPAAYLVVPPTLSEAAEDPHTVTLTEK